MSFKSLMASAFGFTSTAEAAIKADASEVVVKAKALEQRALDAIHDGLTHGSGYSPSVIGSAIQSTPAPSIVGNTVSNLVIISGNFGKTIDSLVEQIYALEDELRQRRASRSAAIAALSSLADDPALTEEEHNALNLEITDHGEDLVAAAIRAQPTPETEPSPAPAPAPVEFPAFQPGVDGAAPIFHSPPPMTAMRVGFTAKL